MPFLVPASGGLATLLASADALHANKRWPQARRAWELLVQRAQEKADRGTEGVSRAMLAWCLLRLRDLEGAREQLAFAARITGPDHPDAIARYRKVLARLAIEDGPADRARTELRAYLRWAEEARQGAAIVDACLLLARSHPAGERAEWLDRGIEQALGLEETTGLGAAYAELAGALDQTGHGERALEAYQQAVVWYRHHGRGRDEVAAGWAVGALACRLEDWPLARTSLEQAIATAERLGDCDDLVALALADLATVYEAAGDVIEARRLLLRSVSLGREQGLPVAWPERWAGVLDHVRRLDVLD
jgi:tetratricopeptide (TPR) repeat protein